MTLTVGTTLFSFTDEWRAGTLSLTQLLERVARLGLGPDVELVGFQSFRGLPAPTQAEVDRFRADVGRLELRPTAFGVYVDRARRPGRWLSVEEGLASLTDQLRTAKRLGFPSTRASLGMDTRLLDRVVPVLESLGILLTFEIQGSHTPDAPDVTTFLAWLQANPDAPVGVTFDSSVAMPDLPLSYRRVLRGAGLTPEVEQQLDAAWRSDGPPFARLGTFLSAIDDEPVPEQLRELFVTAFVRFGHGELSDWLHVLPHVRHAHAKFWDWEGPEAQVVAPHRQFVDLLVAAGYTGSISSEFGGTAWLGLEEVDIFELTRRHVTFLKASVSSSQALHCVERAARIGVRPSTYLELAGL